MGVQQIKGYKFTSDRKTSKRMSSIIPNKTKPELYVKNILDDNGYEYESNVTELPGRPDIVFRNKKKIIFIHGCFWHRHKGCKKNTTPKKNVLYWKNKFKKTCERDKNNQKKLKNMGWDIKVVWECELQNSTSISEDIIKFIER